MPKPAANPAQQEVLRELRRLQVKYARLQREHEQLLALRNARPFHAKPHRLAASGRDNEATVLAVASDWHVAERVDPAMVAGLNRYDPSVSRARAAHFFDRVGRLWEIIRRDIPVPRVILGLLGDFISGSIHADLAESNYLPPADEALLAGDYLYTGLGTLLERTAKAKCELLVVCASGNHGRMTKERRVHTEHGNSLERLIYVRLREAFQHERRVRFVIEPGYHTYVQVYNLTLRFHHGHAIRYLGGIGGLFVPAFRTIARWNTSRAADLDVFGHHHTQVDGGSFLANGSMIGYSAFAVQGGYAYQPPMQTFAVLDRRRGKTAVWPILFPV